MNMQNFENAGTQRDRPSTSTDRNQKENRATMNKRNLRKRFFKRQNYYNNTEFKIDNDVSEIIKIQINLVNGKGGSSNDEGSLRKQFFKYRNYYNNTKFKIDNEIRKAEENLLNGKRDTMNNKKNLRKQFFKHQKNYIFKLQMYKNILELNERLMNIVAHLN